MQGKNIMLLKDLCNDFKKDIVDGPFGANLKREHYTSSGIPVLKIQNVKPFAITLKKMDFVKPDKYEELKRHSYQSGDIIMTKLGDPLGESAIADGIDDGLIVADLVRIRASKVDTRYLCYHLNSPVTQTFINEQQKGTTRPRVRISVVRELPIFTPPISEQKRIVSILDKAFAAIDEAKAKTEQNLKNARELFDSYLQQVFSQRGEGWVDLKIGEILTLEYGKPLDKSDRKKDGLYPAYGANGIKARTNNYYCEKESIIVGRKGSAGELTLTENRYWPLDVTYFVEFDKMKYHLKFIYYMLSKLNLPSLATGVKPGINRNVVYSIKVSIPPIEEQKSVAIVLDKLSRKIQRLEGIYKKKIESTDQLKKSLLQKAFSGELTSSKGEAA